MAVFRSHKVVASLPPTLEPSALYLVRVGSGFDLYATNESGTVIAYSMNGLLSASDKAKIDASKKIQVSTSDPPAGNPDGYDLWIKVSS